MSPSLASREAGEELTSMALACPAGLRKMPEPAMPPPTNNGSSILPWRSSSLSKPATVLLDSAEYRCNDHDSVCSEVTHTTAESSLTSTLVSRDWGAVPHPSSFQGGESPASAPGVYFQAGHVQVPRGAHGYCPATSSLAHALNRFNIDSDCEASLASTSIVDEHIMDEDDASVDCAASLASLASAGSHRSSASYHKRKKTGKTQRLMDRAAAHERKKMRANLVHSQRMHPPAAASGLSSAMAQDLSGSPQSAASSQASTLLHVQHGSTRSQASVSYGQPPDTSQILSPPSMPPPPTASGLDLGRTPTASNCSDMRRLAREMGPPGLYLPSMPTGVHVSTNRSGGMEAPLGYHPQLASRIPTPPSKLVAQEMMAPPIYTSSASISKPSLVHVDAMSAEGSTSASLEHTNYEAAAEDDVMEVAMTLSRLGGMRDRPGPIPRIR